MSEGEADRLATQEAGEMGDDYTENTIDYEAGEPESEEQDDDDPYMSEDEDDEVDELVDEVDDSDVVPETNRRSRRGPLRITLKRKSAKDTPSRRRSTRAPKRTARAREMDDTATREDDEGDEVDEEEEEDDELEASSDGASTAPTEAPMTARQLARANRARGLSTEELVELPMESSKKKKLSETELALRRSETARRRRNQSERKLEDDKIETINRLLKKQAGRVRGKDKDDNDGADEADGARKPRDLKANYPQPMFRYVQRADRSVLAVPRGPPFVESVGNDAQEGLYDATLRCLGTSCD
ncbi:hypothetical protein MNAN1_001053 [Malassezia nana]|uniref:INO80 complex subunit B-like conserved region domain-containing protein n=1 Tax=Malassezia nana TaxID=180528 RepID=A0AAF0J2V4_9BASI|nr:hypothetical protein MNAN1_001053 [Malassezia nana]